MVGATANNGTHPVHLGLHIANASCQTITGDAIAMLRDIIVIGGNGIWTASQ